MRCTLAIWLITTADKTNHHRRFILSFVGCCGNCHWEGAFMGSCRVLSLIVALVTAYSIAFSLDSTMRTMAKLNSSWSELAAGYERIWGSPYTEEAESMYNQLGEKEREISMLATTDAPNDQKRLGKWQDRVFKLRHFQQT